MTATTSPYAEPAPAAFQADLWIGGTSREAHSSSRMAIVNPSDGTTITSVADAGPADARAAVDAAVAARPGWAATPPRERAEILRRCFEIMTDRSERLAHLIALENGKTLADARSEIAYAAEFFRWYSEEAVRITGEISVAPSGANRILVQYQPIGVCVLVTPWNFPAAMATRKLAPALAAGCTTILKPAPATPLTAYEIAAIMAEAGVPGGVVNVITTTSAGPVVAEMLQDARVRKLSFTGSTEVGKVLLREAADHVLKCSMELGGNAPFIVFADADLDAATEGAMVAKMRNGGQACTAANRIYGQRPIHDELASRLRDRMAALEVGPGTNPGVTCGPLIDEAAVQRVARLVDDAVVRGAQTLTGGRRLDRNGFYYAPTVLAHVPPDAKIASEEIFGPVASLIPFDEEDEVIAAANTTEYGLSAYIYTGNLGRGLAVSERLESGMVAINRGLVSDPAAPFGGVKQSGLGREGAHSGLLEFTEAKYVAVSW
jgi:succinate-semialdehyde dehydrogenase/glutarate-semialdehyde dehydrogenase